VTQEGSAPKQWGGRFAKRASRDAEVFTSSLSVDLRLAAEDIAASMAHVLMLGRTGIILRADARAILSGLAGIAADLPALEVDPSAWEDVHSLVEGLLRQRIGDAAGRLHTARSRNDQVAVDERLYARRALADGVQALVVLQRALVEQARANADLVMPGYTHLQRAQPVLYAHHLLAYAEMLDRDAGRLRDAERRADVLPLGSGALAGVPYPIDRHYVAQLLGFSQVSGNSMDAVSDRDFMVEHLAALSLIAVHLSRLAEDLVLWSTAEFGFAEVDEAYATGSSIMPQKKNPDVAELIRGKTGRVIGSLVGLLTVLKGLPLAYNRDLQEDKHGYFDALDTVHASLDLAARMIATLQPRGALMEAAAAGSFSTATDLADHLVKRGLPFREAHHVVGRIVRACIETDRDLPSLTLDELQKFSPLFEQSVVGLTSRQSVGARDVPGGTASGQVREAIERARRRIFESEEWALRAKSRLPAVEMLAALEP
jgi:argininosuccinate lyase